MELLNYAILLFCNLKLGLFTSSDWSAFSTNHKYIAAFVFIFLISSFIIFYLLYKQLNLKPSLLSFICLSSFFALFLLYLRGIGGIFAFSREPSPILMHDLPLFSYYRYLLLCICAVFGILFWCFTRVFKKGENLITLLSYPYLKEEIRILLYQMQGNNLDTLCNFIYTRIIYSSLFSKIFFFIHFLCFYVLRFFMTCLFVNFVFFQGNLSYMFYLLPCSFFVWLLGFLDYYFKIFREGTSNSLIEILKVTPKKTIQKQDYEQGFLVRDTNDFVFSLKPQAFKEGFTTNDLSYLARSWVEVCHITVKFQKYTQRLFLLQLFSGLLMTSCWFFISYTFLNFSGHPENSVFLVILFFRRVSFTPIHAQFTRCPRSLFRFREGKDMNEAYIRTKGGVGQGYYCFGEVEGNELRVDADATHNPPKGKTSVQVAASGVPPDPKPLYAVEIPGGPQYLYI